jgi:hypothetical protein
VTPTNLSIHFEDDYGETLQFTYLGAANIAVEIDQDNYLTLTPNGGWYGTSWIMIEANDSEFNVTGNNVTLIVEYNPPQKTPSPATAYPSPRVASLKILVPEIVTVEEEMGGMAKIILYNDGEYDLRDINLTAITNETNITLLLEDTFIGQMRTGQNVTTWLNITTGDLDVNETYLIQVLADVGYPIFGESATIAIRVTPTNKTLIDIEIVMVKDLFEENPECMELFVLILEAEESLKEGNINEARRLTKLALDNCQDMIDYAKLKTNYSGRVQPPLSGQVILDPVFIMGFVMVLMALTMLGYWLMTRRQPAGRLGEAA